MFPPNDNGFSKCCPSGNTMIDVETDYLKDEDEYESEEDDDN